MFWKFRSFRTCRGRPSARRPVRTRPELEALEDRLAPALFGPAVDYGTGSSPATVAVGIFDNVEQQLDLAVSNLNDGTVSVLRNSSGTFTPFLGSPVPVGGAPEGVAVGDFNRDARLDLLVANDAGYTSYLAGNGDGTFAASVNLTVANAIIVYEAVGDLNGDGRMDFAATDFANNALLVYQGNGDGTFKAPSTIGTNDLFHPEQIAVADLDGDGRPDLAVANQGGTVGVTAFRNTTAGTGAISFAAAQSFSAGINIGVTNPPDFGCTGLVAGDYTGDGKLDLATTDFGSNPFVTPGGPAGNTVSVFRNTGSAGAINFAAAVNVTVGTQPVGLTQGDFDSDGRLDLAAANAGSGGQVSVLLNTGSGATVSFAAAQPFAVGAAPQGLAVNYLRGDGRVDARGGRAPTLDAGGSPDLAVAVTNGTHDAAVLLNQGTAASLSFRAHAGWSLFDSPFLVGDPVPLTLGVNPGADQLPVTGTITLFDGPTALRTFPVNGTPAASVDWTFSGLTIGTHLLTAVYSGDAQHPSATSNDLAVVVAADTNPHPLFVLGSDSRVYVTNVDASGATSGGYSLAAPGQAKSVVTSRTGYTFVIGLDNRVYYFFYGPGSPGGSYVLLTEGAVKAIAVGYSQDGSYNPLGGTYLFALGLDDQVYGVFIDNLGITYTPYGLVAPGRVKSFQVGTDAQNNPKLFVLGPDDRVYEELGGRYALLTGGTVKSFAVSHDALMNPEVFVLGMDNRVYAVKCDMNGRAAGGYFLAAAGTVKDFSVVNDGTNRPMLFVQGMDDRVYLARFDAGGSPVSGYAPAAAGTVKKIVTGHHDGFGVPELFVIGLDERPYAQKYTAAGTAVGGYVLTGSITVKQVSVVP